MQACDFLADEDAVREVCALLAHRLFVQDVPARADDGAQGEDPAQARPYP
jgi:hypothetical protein